MTLESQVQELVLQGDHLIDQGYFRAALYRFQKALRIAESNFEIPDGAVAILGKLKIVALNSIGYIYQNSGNLERAVQFYSEAIALMAPLPSNTLDIATILNNIGTAYKYRGDIKTAVTYFEQALVKSRSVDEFCQETADSLNHLAMSHCALAHYRDALEKLDQALQINLSLDKHSTQTAATLNCMGAVYYAQGQFERALQFFKDAWEIDSKTPTARAETARDLNDIGTVLFAQGDFKGARQSFEEALSIDLQLGDNTESVATRLNNLGSVCWRENDLDSGLDYYLKARRIWNRMAGDGSLEVASLQSNIGSIYQQQAKWSKAISAYRNSIATVERLRKSVGDLQDQEGLFSTQQDPFQGLLICYLRRGSRGDARKAFEVSERTKSRTLVGRLKEKELRSLSRNQLGYFEKKSVLMIKSANLGHRLENGLELFGGQERATLLMRKKKVDIAIVQLQEKIRKEIPAFAALEEPSFKDLPKVRRELIDSDTMLLSYGIAGNLIVGWAIRNSDFGAGVQMFEVGKADEMARQVQLATDPFHRRAEISDHEEDLERTNEQARGDQLKTIEQLRLDLLKAEFQAKEAWHNLTRVLWEQVDGRLKKNVTRVLVMPCSSLYTLPFELLFQDNGILADAYHVSYAPSTSALSSLQDLWRGRGSNSEAPRFLGFGDPLFGSPEIPRLPGTRQEVKRAANLFQPHSKQYFGAKATKGCVEAQIDKATIFLGATHGLFSKNDLLGSGLVLAGGKVWDCRTLLSRRFLLRLELFVGSACDTGKGLELSGEGLIGFSSSLMAAGVKCAILSLWPVDDDTTSDFMVQFFSEWKKTRSVSTALRSARNSIRAKPNFEDPYYWAGFVALGVQT